MIALTVLYNRLCAHWNCTALSRLLINRLSHFRLFCSAVRAERHIHWYLVATARTKFHSSDGKKLFIKIFQFFKSCVYLSNKVFHLRLFYLVSHSELDKSANLSILIVYKGKLCVYLCLYCIFRCILR